MIDRQGAASFWHGWKRGEEGFVPCPEAVEVGWEDECRARIGRLSFFALSPYRRLVRPQLFLAQLAGQDFPVLQREYVSAP